MGTLLPRRALTLAFQLGKRYVQDRELDWGVAVPRASEELDRFAAPGATLAKGAPEEDEEA